MPPDRVTPFPASCSCVVLMGVSGCGKTTVGRLLADLLGGRFIDGDDFHSPKSIAKMHSGVPLTDDDRHQWLEQLAAQIEQHSSDVSPLVIACSALKQSYRDRLRRTRDDLAFVHLEGSKKLLLERLQHRASRENHFMPTTLLDSQLETLENPEGEPLTWSFQIDENPVQLANRIVRQLGA